METYNGLDLHLQYVYFFRNEHLYTDTSNGQSLLLNAITDVNYVQSVFPQTSTI